MRRLVPFRRWLLLGAASLAGCAVGQPAVPLREFEAGDLATVEAFAAREAADGDAENLALVRNVQAQCELLMGRPEEARRNFEAAGQIMGSWATSGSEATGAILGSESSKTYKGDPYEKAMNAFYLGFCYLLKGEPDNARAACKRGILMDAEVGDEKFQADNALLFWMAGRMSKLMGSDDAAGFYAEAKTANEFAIQHGARGDANNPVLADPGHGNLVLLCECGMGPEKYADGAQQELARFRSRPHPAVGARATLDGEPLGNASLMLDVDYQARTLGGTVMEGIRKGKAVFKTASTVAGVVLLSQAANDHGDKARTEAIAGGALLALGLLTSSSADVRHWPTLPSTVHALAVDVPPGEHALEVEFFDARGRALPAMRQQTQVTVPATGETWLLFRSLPAAHPAGTP
ncbi:MAG TPA: hypothetical protein VFZ65_16940 [Planctomycetota bacterium]|nr:hypothetical protein [Planctomycetota bacterium]